MLAIYCSALFLSSTSSLRFSSASRFCSASRTIRSISSLLKPELPEIVICCSFAESKSLADTLTIPLTSIENVTSIRGSPRREGLIPSSLKRPSNLLSWAIGRSP